MFGSGFVKKSGNPVQPESKIRENRFFIAYIYPLYPRDRDILGVCSKGAHPKGKTVPLQYTSGPESVLL